MTPEGMLRYANKVIGEANKAGKGGGNIKLTDAEVKTITDTMTEIQMAMSGELKLVKIDLQKFADTKLAEVFRLIQSKIPADMAQKLKGLQRINLLLNPTTMARNTLGNMGSYGVSTIGDYIAAGLDKVTSLFTGKRTSLMPQLGKQAKGFKEGFKRVGSDYKADINTSPTGTQYELDVNAKSASPFKNKTLKFLDKLTTTGLRYGDDPFYQGYYDDFLQREMKLANANKATPEMIERADKIARQRTFQDKNQLSDAILSLRRSINKITGNPDFGLGNLVIPFGRTPANILARAFEYSPAQIGNLIKVAVRAIGKEGFDQRLFVESLSKGLTGSGILMAGYELGKRGILSGKAPKDKDARNFQKATGYLPYSAKIGDNTYTFDWAQPYAIPLSMGVDMYESFKNSKNPDKAILESLKAGGDTLFSQSMLQGLNRAFGGSSSGFGGSMTENLVDSALSSTSQFIPLGSLARKVSDATDPYARDTYSEDSVERYVANPLKNAYPFTRGKLPAKVNVLGEKTEAYNKPDALAPFRTLRPFNVGGVKEGSAINEINRLYDVGLLTQIPRTASNKITYKLGKNSESQTLTLTTKQKNNFQEMLGKSNVSEIEKTIKLPEYKKGNDKEKADLIKDAMTNVQQRVENDFLKQQGIKEYEAPKKPGRPTLPKRASK